MRYRYNKQVDPPAPLVHVVVRRADGGAVSQPIPALVDSGADRTVIPLALAEELALPQAGIIELAGLNQTVSTLPIHVVQLSIGDLPAAIVEVLAAAGEQYALLGRDALNRYRFVLDGPAQLCTIELP